MSENPERRGAGPTLPGIDAMAALAAAAQSLAARPKALLLPLAVNASLLVGTTLALAAIFAALAAVVQPVLASAFGDSLGSIVTGLLVGPAAALVTALVQAFLVSGTIGFALRALRGQPVVFDDVFEGGAYVVPVAVTLFLSWLGSGVGLCACLVPGSLWLASCTFAPQLAIDRKLSGLVALRESFALARNRRLELLAFWISVALLQVLAALPCCLGYVVTLPMVPLALAHLYLTALGELPPVVDETSS